MASVFARSVFALLFFGCLSSLSLKTQMTITSVDSQGVAKPLAKPMFATFQLSAGMALLLPLHYWRSRRRKPAMSSLPSHMKQPLIETHEVAHGEVSASRAFFMIGIPATFDIAASAFTFIGLLYLPPSIWQMFRGAMIIFAAMLSMPLLGRYLNGNQWLGVSICCVGIVVAGGADLLTTEANVNASVGEALLGMIFVLLGQIMAAAQAVVEEKLLKDVNLCELQIVGFEGIWGLAILLLIVFPAAMIIPGSDNGHFEDTYDTVIMLRNSPTLHMFVWVVVFSWGLYTYAGMVVTNMFSAVHRTMVTASWTLVVIWGIDLLVYYYVSQKIPFGEAWSVYSPLELFGVLLIVYGNFVYNTKSVKASEPQSTTPWLVVEDSLPKTAVPAEDYSACPVAGA